MKQKLEQAIWEYIGRYCEQKGIENIWEKPIVKFADAKNPLFESLKELVVKDHYHPTDFLPNASIVLSYYLPFQKQIGQSNVGNTLPSDAWVKAYIDTTDMANGIHCYLAAYLQNRGVASVTPTNIKMISKEIPMSRWSQRHVAFIAGQGTFGVNNMLISEKGCAGRYFSIVTDLDVESDLVVTKERCLYKKNGTCKVCVERCIADAFTDNGFDRFKCLKQCLKNQDLYPGAGVCGKCVAGLPCSYLEG